jgi:DNA-binding MarR family transcriptional regulator
MARARSTQANLTEAAKHFTDLVLETFRLNGRLIFVGDRLTKSLGLSTARWQILGAIALAHGPLTVAEIARSMGLKRQSVQRTVDVLAGDGLVKTADNPNHRRAKLVLFSAKGAAVYAKVNAIQVNWANQISTAVLAKDLHNAVLTLRALRRRLEISKKLPP